ncbi:hypothetical protein DYL61_29420 [Pseudomonas nabeulensis]|uniref:DUF2384 domain-containing protein n=1 Tax=Pseudomonas nabeulensis TaxID=2293833 RepID=A0A4Z0AFH4_9PSED|nr:hypothetical protein [Pseudomonas nabeulensis]TFY85526.1 hypothetical protein DYL61_29420 [Pseudomonas nabeulensis]
MVFRSDSVDIVRESFEIETPSQGTVGVGYKIVLTVDASSQELVDAYVCSLEMLSQVFLAHLQPLPADTISSIASLMIPQKPVPSMLLRETRMLAQAKTEILQSSDWVTANGISNLAQLSSSNPSSQPNKWKQAGKIFALRHKGIDYFPIYGLDPTRGFRPFSTLKCVISTLSTMKDGWAMAFWFASPNTFLGGKRPKEIFSTDPAGVLSAAKDEVSGAEPG